MLGKLLTVTMLLAPILPVRGVAVWYLRMSSVSLRKSSMEVTVFELSSVLMVLPNELLRQRPMSWWTTSSWARSSYRLLVIEDVAIPVDVDSPALVNSESTSALRTASGRADHVLSTCSGTVASESDGIISDKSMGCGAGVPCPDVSRRLSPVSSSLVVRFGSVRFGYCVMWR